MGETGVEVLEKATPSQQPDITNQAVEQQTAQRVRQIASQRSSRDALVDMAQAGVSNRSGEDRTKVQKPAEPTVRHLPNEEELRDSNERLRVLQTGDSFEGYLIRGDTDKYQDSLRQYRGSFYTASTHYVNHYTHSTLDPAGADDPEFRAKIEREMKGGNVTGLKADFKKVLVLRDSSDLGLLNKENGGTFLEDYAKLRSESNNLVRGQSDKDVEHGVNLMHQAESMLAQRAKSLGYSAIVDLAKENFPEVIDLDPVQVSTNGFQFPREFKLE